VVADWGHGSLYRAGATGTSRWVQLSDEWRVGRASMHGAAQAQFLCTLLHNIKAAYSIECLYKYRCPTKFTALYK